MKIEQMLLTINQFSRPGTKIKPTAIAWHWTGNAKSSALNNRNYFENLKVGIKDSKGRYKYASSHLVVGLDGEVIQCIPFDEISYCTNDANSYTISIECCHPDSTGKFTEKTYKSMVELAKYLEKELGITKHIRHYDVTKKCCPKYFVDNPDKWMQFLDDIKQNEGVLDMNVYKSLNDIPEWFRNDIKELIDNGIIKGNGENLGLTEQDVKSAVISKRICEHYYKKQVTSKNE